MDTFWVIPLLIFGAIVSIGQKASKNATPKGEEGDAIPTPEQEDIERRIREILEGKAEPTKRQNTTPTPSARPAHMDIASQAPKQASTSLSPKNYSPRKASIVMQAKSAATSHAKKNSASKSATDPIKQGEIKHSEIGRIIDDFSVEKATIYAEIMKPKYEEY